MISEFDFYQEIIYLTIHITTGSPHHWSYLMIFLSEKRFPYFDKIHNYSSIYNKLSFDVTTISLVLTLSYFSLLDIVLFVLIIGPAGCDSCQKKVLKQNNFCKL